MCTCLWDFHPCGHQRFHQDSELCVRTRGADDPCNSGQHSGLRHRRAQWCPAQQRIPLTLLCSMWSPEVFSPQYLVTIMVFAVVFEHFHPLGQSPGLGSSLLEKERR